MLTTQTLTALSAALALGFTACGQSAAAQYTQTASVKVSFADLNLSSEADAEAMLQRIRNAAEKVCGIESDDSLYQAYEYRPCVKATADRAVAKLHNPVVTALNSGRTAPAPTALASNR